MIGVPEGYRPIAWKIPKEGDLFVHGTGVAVCTLSSANLANQPRLIVERKLESCRHRAFADAEEFLSACETVDWLINVQTGHLESVLKITDNGINTVSGFFDWVELLAGFEFRDGGVCGYENQ